eukprot:4626704-Amphidinium_carterae.1
MDQALAGLACMLMDKFGTLDAAYKWFNYTSNGHLSKMQWDVGLSSPSERKSMGKVFANLSSGRHGTVDKTRLASESCTPSSWT